MPASERSLRITDTYRGNLNTLSDRAAQLVAQQWGRVTMDDLPGSHAAWLAAAVALLTQAQRTAVRYSSAYLTAFIASETGSPARPLLIDETLYAGLADDGEPLEVPLSKTLIGVRAALADGKTAAEAFDEQGNRAQRLAAGAAMHAPREALGDTIAAHPDIVGWRRVTHGGCGACLASAASGYAKHERLRVHPHCHCTQEPVIRDAPDTTRRPTGPEVFAGMSREQQDQALGPDAAQAVREGRIAWPDLIGHSPMVVGPDLLTQRPLAAAVQ